MKIHVYGANDRAHKERLMPALRGLERHGLTYEIIVNGRVRECDLAIAWGARREAQLKSGRRAMIVERGYIGDRFIWTSMGFDGLNGHADFCNARVKDDRWAQHFEAYLKPQRKRCDGEHVLLIGQVYNDAALKGTNIGHWYRNVIDGIHGIGEKIVFRHHPARRSHHKSVVEEADDITPDKEPLSESMAKAKWVVTFNSNVGVDATLAGVPVVACDNGSMVWGLVPSDPLVMPRLDAGTEARRERWAHSMAYTQWSPLEMADGLAWEHLRQGMVQ